MVKEEQMSAVTNPVLYLQSLITDKARKDTIASAKMMKAVGLTAAEVKAMWMANIHTPTRASRATVALVNLWIDQAFE